VIAASIFVAAGVENGAGLSLSLGVDMVCMAIIHCNIATLQLDQWITAYRETVDTNFKAIDSHGTVSWITFLHQRMLLMNRTIETLCLQQRGKVKLYKSNSITATISMRM